MRAPSVKTLIERSIKLPGPVEVYADPNTGALTVDVPRGTAVWGALKLGTHGGWVEPADPPKRGPLFGRIELVVDIAPLTRNRVAADGYGGAPVVCYGNRLYSVSYTHTKPRNTTAP